jgi:hypothetical protein
MIIDQAYDEFHTVVTAALNAYGAALTPAVEFKELDDNLIIENNDNKKLKNGFAVRFEGDQNDGRQLSEITGVNQTVFVTFTTANFGTIRDTDKRKAAEKKLLAMKDSVKVAIGANPQLNDTVASCLYVGTDPVELILDDNEKLFLMVKSTYTISYFE